MAVLLLIAAPLVAYVVWWYLYPKIINMPPEPVLSIPLVGHILSFDKTFHLKALEWYKQAGPIFTYRVGPKSTVAVCGYDLMKEMLVKRAEEFNNRQIRFTDETAGATGEKFGILSLDGEKWVEQRKFLLGVMRNFGVGKTLMADKITGEAEKLCSWLDDYVGTNNIYLPLRFCIGNIVSALVFGKTYELGDEKFEKMIEVLDELFEILGSAEFGFLNDYPWMRHISSNGLRYPDLQRVNKEVEKFFTEEFEQIGNSLDMEGEATNIAEAYMLELHKRNKTGQMGYFSIAQMFAASGDLWVGGMGTTITTLRWGILYMMKYPEIQEKVRAEIHSALGTAAVPTLEDRAKLPYTCAVITEMQRFANTTDTLDYYMSLETTKLGGYTIPAKTRILPIVYTVHMDPALFPEPEKFKPERFLDASGKNVVKNDYVIPFGMGRRLCLGENLAKMELFIIFTMVMQRFSFKIPPGPNPSMEAKRAFTLQPLQYECVMTRVD